MAPKAAPAADPAEAVTAALGASQGAADAIAKAAALEPIIGLLGDAASLAACVDQAQPILEEVGSTLTEVAGVAAAELSSELSSAAATGTQLVAAFCEAGTVGVALAPCLAPLLTIIATPERKAARQQQQHAGAPAPAAGARRRVGSAARE